MSVTRRERETRARERESKIKEYDDCDRDPRRSARIVVLLVPFVLRGSRAARGLLIVRAVLRFDGEASVGGTVMTHE